MKKATMQDVAKLAGVSQSTVSFVFSGADMRISESTKQKVFEAASELGFAPRGKLKNYHKVSDSVLALLVPNMSNLYYPALAKEVDEIAAAKGYGLIVINTNRSETKEARYFKLLISLKVAGILYGFTPGGHCGRNRAGHRGRLRQLKQRIGGGAFGRASASFRAQKDCGYHCTETFYYPVAQTED